MPRFRRAPNYTITRHISEQLLLRAFASRWLATFHYQRGWHPPVRIWEEQIHLPEAVICPPLRVVFASDFHAGPMTHPAVLVAACQAIADLRPDLLLLGGDYVSWDQRFISELAPLLGAIPAPLGRYAVLGNHDVWADDLPIQRSLQQHGISVLINSEVILPPPYQSIQIYGMDDPTAGQPQSPDTLVATDAFRIALIHSPEGLAVLRPQHYHLAIAGHTHGGQVALPGGYPIRLTPGSLSQRYAAGRYRVEGTDRTILVSRGVGYGDLTLRWNAPADVLLATMKCS
ncbi:MAG: metallophosphoesterase [Roseiflexaceae bacterium]|nr:metallophosphoesterase [Roseiflexaceae bacterium]